MIDSSFLYKKLVDKSTLFQGFSIPVKYQPLFLQLCEGMLVHGESITNKAVGELQEKINDQLHIPCPITTFHKTGYAVR